MGTEITVKILNNVNEIDRRLKSTGWTLFLKNRIEDYYFSSIDKGHIKSSPYENLLNKSIIIRSYSESNMKEHVVLCYKQKIIVDGNVIDENKTKIPINESKQNETVQMLRQAGFTEWCHLINNSSYYRRNDREVAIQNVEGLGIFLEMEEPDNWENVKPEEKFIRLMNDAKDLGLDLGTDFSIKKPYMKLHKVFKNL